ncbi:MAG TPA: sigma 54-interacting transcriptional regulator, partial [Anaeromyxobacteraceae bacterium]|nr:sigma 54-interacting transcriptional regulator [Anaeromyxobacteraceae bacterium]
MPLRLPVLDDRAAPAHHDPHVQIVEETISTILSTVDIHSVMERTGRLLNRRFGETRVAIHRLFQDRPGELQVALVSDPRHAQTDQGTWFAATGSAAGAAIGGRAPIVVDPISATSGKFREEAQLAALGYGSLVSFPLLFEDQTLGALDIAHPPSEGLLDCCFQVARQVADLVAIALHNSLMVEEVRRLNSLLDRENALLKAELRQVKRETRYVAESPAMRMVLERVRLVAPSLSTVLVRGETGTGKEGLARMVHDLSPRFGAPFVAVNLAAMPENLVESELFGHEKGAFTGALRRKPGRFEQAEGGTIFLDEVGDASPAVQVRLLRVLQEKELQLVGSTETRKVDVRVVAATNKNLEEMVAAGTFRADLYYRLAVFPIQLPRLRDRREDVRPLARWFLEKHASAMHRKPPAVSEATWQALESQPWPGNVRELENFVQRALILSPGRELVLPDLAICQGGNCDRCA